jgi:hypothetical protein
VFKLPARIAGAKSLSYVSPCLHSIAEEPSCLFYIAALSNIRECLVVHPQWRDELFHWWNQASKLVRVLSLASSVS